MYYVQFLLHDGQKHFITKCVKNGMVAAISSGNNLTSVLNKNNRCFLMEKESKDVVSNGRVANLGKAPPDYLQFNLYEKRELTSKTSPAIES